MKTMLRKVLWAILGFYAYSFAASAGLDTMPSTIKGKPGKIIDSTAKLKSREGEVLEAALCLRSVENRY